MTLTQHPFSAAFPVMTAKDFQALKDDIEVNGQREPIVIFDGMVLDGWHRYQACVQLCLEAARKPFDSADDPATFVKSMNFHRRHLSASQRAAFAVKPGNWFSPHRPNKGAAAAPLSKTNAQLAQEAQVSPRLIKDAKAAQKGGLSDAVMAGRMTAEAAARVTRGKLARARNARVSTPTPTPPDDGPSADELVAAERSAAEELEALRKLALSDDKLPASLEENKQLRAMNRVLTERINGLMNEKSELVKRVRWLQRRVDQLEQPA